MNRRAHVIALTSATAVVTGCSSGPSDSTGWDAPSPLHAADAAVADAAVADADAAAPLWVNPEGCLHGGVGATFRGVAAYCQPPGTTTADQFYQCDELANRFARDALAHPALDNVVTQFASSICGAAASMSAYSAWGPGYRSSRGHRPGPGDLVVWSGQPGHVQVVVGSKAPSSIEVMQQNEVPSVTQIDWSATYSFFTDPGVECWVHAEPAPPARPPSGPPCGCFDGDGDYCGLSIVDHAWWYACSADVADVSYDTLYSCAGGTFVRKTACPGMCLTAELVPATGTCASADPCASVPSSDDGWYCGSSTQSGFAGGASDRLYQCIAGVTAATRSCTNGCRVAPAGQSDGCN